MRKPLNVKYFDSQNETLCDCKLNQSVRSFRATLADRLLLRTKVEGARVASQPVVSWIFAVVFVLGMASPMQSQVGGAGSVSGVVSDPSGAVIPSATVTAINVATGIKIVRKTTSAGIYTLSPLPTGNYQLTIAAPGFETLVQNNIHVNALAAVGFNGTLKIGSPSEEVVVDAAPPLLNTTDAAMTYTFPNEAYEALPLGLGNGTGGIGRDPLAFVSLLPGVASLGNFSAGTVGGLPAQSGGSAHAGEVYLEGAPLTNAINQSEARYIEIGVNIEGVDQFQLESASASVQFFGQGSTNLTLKSGTNHYHGSVYEYIRNTIFDARPSFSTTMTRAPEKRNEFGGSVGGFLLRNKLFFFASLGEFRQRLSTAPATLTVPTLKERQGDFSELLPLGVKIYDPRTTSCVGNVCKRTPFPGNIIPASAMAPTLSSLSPASQYLQNNGSPNRLPTPINSGLSANFISSNPNNDNAQSTTDKVDWTINKAHNLSVVFSHGSQIQDPSGPYTLNTLPFPYGDGRLIDTYGTTALVKYVWVISPNLVNQSSYSYNRIYVPIKNVTIGGDWMDKAGVTGLPGGEASAAFPVISWSGSNSPTNWRGNNSPAFNEAGNDTSVVDNLSLQHGKHSIVAGGQYQWFSENLTVNTSGSNATWGFSSAMTEGFNAAGAPDATQGNAYASFLLGAVGSATVNDYYVNANYPRFRDYAFWLQDTYKASPKLSLNVGLRYDYRTPWTDLKNHMSWLNPTLPNPAIGGYPGALQFAGYGQDSCSCRTNLTAWHDSFGPRIGFAYSLTQNMVIRAGYQMTYTYNNNQNSRQGTGLLGYAANAGFTSPDGYSPPFYWDNGLPAYQKAPFFDPTLNTGFYKNGTATVSAGSIAYANEAIAARPPRFQNFNLTIDEAFTPTLSLEVAYVGSNAHGVNGGSVTGTVGPATGRLSNQMDPKYLVLGNLLTATATPANIAAAAAIVPGISLPFANFSGTISQMLRPFPQYSSVTMPWTNNGNVIYNSLQIIVNKKISNGLLVNGNVVWSKSMSDMPTSRSLYVNQWTVVTSNPPWLAHLIATYQLPFGNRRRFAGGGAVIRAIDSGWQISGIGNYQSGSLLGAIGATCNLPNAGSCYANYNPAFTGSVRLNGSFASHGVGPGVVYLDKNAFVNPAPYTYGNTPPVGVYDLHSPASYNVDTNVRRDFSLPEGLVLRLQADAFNVFNFVTYGGPNTSLTSTSFGTITSATSKPRELQFAARILF